MPKLSVLAQSEYPTGIHFTGWIIQTEELTKAFLCDSCHCPIEPGEAAHAWLMAGETTAVAMCVECCETDFEEVLRVLE